MEEELRRHTCEEHPDAEPLRNERFDAFYCAVCRAWLSPKCVNGFCMRCKGRPDTAPLDDVDDEPTKDL